MDNQEQKSDDKETFKPAPWGVFSSTILLGLLTLFCVRADAPYSMYAYLGVIYIILVIFSILPRVWIAKGYIQKRNAFGFKSKAVNLNSLSSLYVYKKIEPKRFVYIAVLEDVTGNDLKLRIEAGPYLKTLWTKSARLKQLLGSYAKQNNLQSDELTRAVLKLQ